MTEPISRYHTASEAIKKIEKAHSHTEAFSAFLLEYSVWWFQSGRNQWVHAPKFAQRMEIGDQGFQLRLGANLFLVEKFLRRGLDECRDIAEAAKLGVEYDFPTAKYVIERELRKCVMHESGMLYSEYPVQAGYLVFGTHGINVEEAFTSMCGISSIHKLLTMAKH